MIELANNKAVLTAPPEQVFNYVTNLENYPHWFPEVKSVEEANALPHGEIGKRYSETLQLAEGEAMLNIEVVQSEPYWYFVTQGDLPELLPQMSICFSQLDPERCEMSLKYHCRNPELVEDSELIKALRVDLKQRSLAGLLRLQHHFEQLAQ